MRRRQDEGDGDGPSSAAILCMAGIELHQPMTWPHPELCAAQLCTASYARRVACQEGTWTAPAQIRSSSVGSPPSLFSRASLSTPTKQQLPPGHPVCPPASSWADRFHLSSSYILSFIASHISQHLRDESAQPERKKHTFLRAPVTAECHERDAPTAVRVPSNPRIRPATRCPRIRHARLHQVDLDVGLVPARLRQVGQPASGPREHALARPYERALDTLDHSRRSPTASLCLLSVYTALGMEALRLGRRG